MDKPRFEHDCDSCKFLGTAEGGGTYESFDLYWCNDGDLLLRFGDEGPEYVGTMVPEAFAGAQEWFTNRLRLANGVFNEDEKAKFNEVALAGLQARAAAYIRALGQATLRDLYTGDFAHFFR